MASIADLCDAIYDTLKTVTGVAVPQNYDEMGDAINADMTMQVWPFSWAPIAADTERRTLRGGVHLWEIVIHVDLMTPLRLNIGEHMAALVPVIDAINAKLNDQQAKPLFGEVGIDSFTWSGEYATINYSSQTTVGARWTITVRTVV